jgi:deferrochelatase/peroxidase EfeB
MQPRPSSPSAERMARHRLRRKQGLRSLTIDIREAEIDTLIQRGRLAPESRGDLAAIKKAVHGFLDDTLK